MLCRGEMGKRTGNIGQDESVVSETECLDQPIVSESGCLVSGV